MKFRIKVKSKDKTTTWWETYDNSDVTTLDEAKDFGTYLMGKWNSSLRPHDVERELVDVEKCAPPVVLPTPPKEVLRELVDVSKMREDSGKIRTVLEGDPDKWSETLKDLDFRNSLYAEEWVLSIISGPDGESGLVMVPIHLQGELLG